jgi:hypothetical protein
MESRFGSEAPELCLGGGVWAGFGIGSAPFGSAIGWRILTGAEDSGGWGRAGARDLLRAEKAKGNARGQKPSAASKPCQCGPRATPRTWRRQTKNWSPAHAAAISTVSTSWCCAGSGPIYALAYRVIGREEDARDVAQETFLRAFRALSGFKGQAKVLVLALPHHAESLPRLDPPRTADADRAGARGRRSRRARVEAEPAESIEISSPGASSAGRWPRRWRCFQTISGPPSS